MVSTKDFESFNLGSNPSETIHVETPNKSIWGRIAQLAEHQSYELNVPISIIGTTKGEKYSPNTKRYWVVDPVGNGAALKMPCNMLSGIVTRRNHRLKLPDTKLVSGQMPD